MATHSDAVMDMVARASARAAARVHQEMKRGLSSLASIAATAPRIGLFGTVVGIQGFRVLDEGRIGIMISFAGAVSLTLTMTALGLLVGIIASCFYAYLSNRLESLDTEMHNASLDLLNRLSLYRLEERV